MAARSERPAVVVPRVISGFTDAHYFRELGLVAYGFVPRWLDTRDTRGIHGPNERISVDNLTRGVRVLVEILEELDRGDGTDARPPRRPEPLGRQSRSRGLEGPRPGGLPRGDHAWNLRGI